MPRCTSLPCEACTVSASAVPAMPLHQLPRGLQQPSHLSATSGLRTRQGLLTSLDGLGLAYHRPRGPIPPSPLLPNCCLPLSFHEHYTLCDHWQTCTFLFSLQKQPLKSLLKALTFFLNILHLGSAFLRALSHPQDSIRCEDATPSETGCALRGHKASRPRAGLSLELCGHGTTAGKAEWEEAEEPPG